MEAAAIRDAIKVKPFQPFRLRLADGREERVLHPDFILVSPGGRRVIVVHPDDSMAIIEPLLIVSLEFATSGLQSGPVGDDDSNGKGQDAPS